MGNHILHMGNQTKITCNSIINLENRNGERGKLRVEGKRREKMMENYEIIMRKIY